ncbi:Y-family DNA polymerase [Marinobacter sp. C2H3]|uniref:Y-family DNA polymerase n=1 Tax=Marinobacter sp. C2H3 TaxID=3119003 RepID=UPI00300E9F41
MLWLYLHFPHLLLDHLRRDRQDDQPLAIVDSAGQRIVQACPNASHLGIQAGQRLKTALSLAESLHLVHTDSAREARLLDEQAGWLYHLAAHLVPEPPDGLMAEVGSLQRLYGGLPAVWQSVEQALNERRLTAWVATGHTPLAARLLARSGRGECTDDAGHHRRLLDNLPLAQAGFDATTSTRLQRLGLTTFGQVAALPPAELARRLSPETLAYLQKVLGTRPDPRAPWQPPHEFRQQADFVQDIQHTQGLLFPLQRMLNELEDDLCWRQQDTDSLHLRLVHRHHEDTRLRIRTAAPEHRAEAFLNLIRLRLDQQTLAAPVVSLRLLVRRFLGRDAPAGQDLLGEQTDLNEAWYTLISRLQARLGDQAITQLAPAADHRPERAWLARSIRQAQAPRKPTHEHAPHRPLWLLPGPHPLTETPVDWLSGPERIRGGWWDGQPVHRDYYIARLHSGQLAWVFRDVRDGWFIHGWFG